MQKHHLWFEIRGRKSGDANITTVLLLHGFTGSHLTWNRLCDALEGDYFFVIPDLPGHGNSFSKAGMGVSQISDALLDLLDDLGVEKTALLGYSMGGRIALDFAMKYPDRLVCLILESTSPGIQDQNEREARKLKDETLAEEIERNGLTWFVDKWENQELFATQLDLDPYERQKIRNERLGNSASGLAASLQSAGTGSMRPLWSQLAELRTPVLLIVGEKDEKYSAAAKKMMGLMSDCMIKIIKNAGHATHLENHQEFEETVKQFLNDVYSRQNRGIPN